MRIRSKAIAGTALALGCCMMLSACSSDVHKVGGRGAEQLDLTGYAMTFEDNFDGDHFNTEYWRYPYAEEGVRKGGYWVNDAVSVRDGNLYITTDYREDGKFGPGWYSGCIETAVETYGGDETGAAENHKGFSQTYGYFEVRCKVPEIVGSWAAFWMMRTATLRTISSVPARTARRLISLNPPTRIWRTTNCTTASRTPSTLTGMVRRSSPWGLTITILRICIPIITRTVCSGRRRNTSFTWTATRPGAPRIKPVRWRRSATI